VNPAGGSRRIVHFQPTEDWKDCLNPTHHRQVVDGSSPTCALNNGKRGLGLNDPPPAGGGIQEVFFAFVGRE